MEELKSLRQECQALNGDTNSAPLPSELSREQLLNAIDFEISQRTSATTRHGVTVWTIASAVVGLLGAAVNEILDSSHIVVDVVLTLFVTYWGFHLLISVWSETVKSAAPKVPQLRRSTFFSREIHNLGVHPGIVPFIAAEAALLLFLSVYLGFEGFWVLNLFAAAFLCPCLMLTILAWAMCHIRIPLNGHRHSFAAGHSIPWGPIVYSGMGVTFLVGMLSFAQVAPSMAKPDFRLGLYLGLILVLFSTSLKLSHPPAGLHELRILRSKLAFGWIGIPGARREIENILLGPTDLSYIVGKAEAVIAEQKFQQELCESSKERWERLPALAEKVKSCVGDQEAKRDCACEFRALFQKVKSDAATLQQADERSKKLRAKLLLHLEAARFLLNLPPSAIDDLLCRVNACGQTAVVARQKVAEAAKESNESATFLCTALKGAEVPKGRTISEIVQVLFRN